MKKTILILFTVAIAAVNVKAQEKKPAVKSPEERTEKMVGRLNDVLALNDEQKVKAKDIILKREQKRTELHKQYEKDKQSFKKANRENMKSGEEELKKILTPEQSEKLKKHHEEMKQKHKGKRASKTLPKEGDKREH